MTLGRACWWMVLVLAGCGSDGVIDLLARAPDGAVSDSSRNDAAGDASASADVAIETSPPCMNGSCLCGLTPCSTTCVDLLNDPTHCGDCTTGTLHFQFCHAGSPECLPGFTLCNGACRHLSSDPDHCGGCTHPPCAPGEKCENGVCTSGLCSAGLTGCPSANNRLACVNMAHGTPYCGDCATVCAPDQICAGGSCRSYTPATPCTACPCAADCARTQGSPSLCCPGVGGNTQPICVHGDVCPQ